MMTRTYRSVLLGIAAMSLMSCGRSAPPPASRVEEAVAPRELLTHLVEQYWDESVGVSPWYSWGAGEMRYGQAPTDILSAQSLADALALERRYLAAVLLVPRAPLDADSKLTYDIFWRERALTIESLTFPSELLPINAYDAVPQRFAVMAAAAERYALTSARDLEVWSVRASLYERWTAQAIANLREGMRRGYLLPRAVVERTLPMLAALGEDTQSNALYQATPAGALGAPDTDRARLIGTLNSVVRDKILPCYRALHDFLQREYLPRARSSVGLFALPLGASWYAHLVKQATGGMMPASALHALGLAEVERAHARLQSLLAATAYGGNAAGFIDGMRHDPRFSYKSADELLSAYQEFKTRVAAATTSLFSVTPRSAFELRSVEDFREATMPALAYQRSLAFGKIPAVLYVNTRALETLPAIDVRSQFLREAVPGHHYQTALQQERSDLPRFRRFGGSAAFEAGWGLYAASLGEELGVYSDPEAEFGSLLAQLQCAVGMVVDTGIHAKKWTRQQALDYVHAQIPLDDVAVANLVDRDIALPGEALACTLGFMKFQSLRTRAQQALGVRFEAQAFHAELLKNGAVPLDLLEANVKQWVETVVASPAKVD